MRRRRHARAEASAHSPHGRPTSIIARFRSAAGVRPGGDVSRSTPARAALRPAARKRPARARSAQGRGRSLSGVKKKVRAFSEAYLSLERCSRVRRGASRRAASAGLVMARKGRRPGGPERPPRRTCSWSPATRARTQHPIPPPIRRRRRAAGHWLPRQASRSSARRARRAARARRPSSLVLDDSGCLSEQESWRSDQTLARTERACDARPVLLAGRSWSMRSSTEASP